LGAVPSQCRTVGFSISRPADGEEDPTCRFRPVSPRFFAVLGVPILAGRDFTDEDRNDTELVAMVSQSVAQRLFSNGDAVNRRVWFANTEKAQASSGRPVPGRSPTPTGPGLARLVQESEPSNVASAAA